MNTRFVRRGGVDDARRIADIYNQGIEDRVATYETALRGPADIVAWFDNG